jgi:hypothetical protein
VVEEMIEYFLMQGCLPASLIFAGESALFRHIVYAIQTRITMD